MIRSVTEPHNKNEKAVSTQEETTESGRCLRVFSVVICTRNEEQHIGRCLDSLLDGTYPSELIQVIVCDGRSTDRTRAIVDQYAQAHCCIELLDNPGLTAPVGFNLGINASRGDYIAILGAHATVAPNWVERSVQALQSHPDASGVGGHMSTRGKGRWGNAIAQALSSRFGVGNCSFRVGTGAGWVDTIVFGAYRRETFRRFGVFDEELPRNQDDEFNYRINAKGGRLWFDPGIQTVYFSRSSPARLYLQYAQYGFWKPMVLRKCPGVFSWRQLAPPLLVLAVVISVLMGFIWPAAWLITALIALSYCAMSLAASVIVAGKRLSLVPLLLLLFPMIHVSYGLHFVLGMSCLALHRKPSPRHSRLTRS